MMNYILVNRQPVPCHDFRKYAEWMAREKQIEQDGHQAGQCRVGWTEVGESEVSTVFLGLDHSFGNGSPVLFETMVFGGPMDGDCEQYCTWDEAEEGHRLMVASVKVERVIPSHPKQEGR